MTQTATATAAGRSSRTRTPARHGHRDQTMRPASLLSPLVALTALAVLLALLPGAAAQTVCGGVTCGDGGPNWTCSASGACTCAADDHHLVPTEEGPSPSCRPCRPRSGDLVSPFEPDRFECRCPVNTQFNLDPSEEACNACGAGATGSGGGYSTCDCEPGRLKCGRACADAHNDDNHCGACNNRCAVGQTCLRGQCVCARYYFSQADPTQPGGVRCQECDLRTTRFFGAPAQEECVCELGYNNFDPNTGACSPAFVAYPVAAGFTAANDPSEWQFGTTNRRGDPSSFEAFTSFGPAPYPAAAGQVSCLTFGGTAQTPYACRTAGSERVRATDEDFFFEPPPAVNLQPSSDKRLAVARFTVPESGTWVVHGAFSGDSRASAAVQINRNGEKIFRGAVQTEPMPDGSTVFRPVQFRVPFGAQAGDALDLSVGDRGSSGTDWVTLDATVLKAVEQSAPLDCRAGRLSCGGKCVNPFRDEKACGQCSISCASDERCCDGVCHHLRTDRDNCGACGKRCVGATPYCVDGRCAY